MPIWKSNRKNLFVMWHHGTWNQKMMFISKPFLQDIIFVWLDAWSATPLPALTKFVLSLIIFEVMLLPMFLFLLVILLYFGFYQYQINSLYPNTFPVKVQSIHWLQQILKRSLYTSSQAEYFHRKVHGVLLITAGMIDYTRILLELM
ncbi:uncharacterized protein LOC134208708 [Armigeres subalbatus]|uniref:uncharacterized protein LOC134208708 n=1 Tax=Armigeres subalbatus TaxID=124917 RepID=UPI002ED6815C